MNEVNLSSPIDLANEDIEILNLEGSLYLFRTNDQSYLKIQSLNNPNIIFNHPIKVPSKKFIGRNIVVCENSDTQYVLDTRKLLSNNWKDAMIDIVTYLPKSDANNYDADDEVPIEKVGNVYESDPVTLDSRFGFKFAKEYKTKDLLVYSNDIEVINRKLKYILKFFKVTKLSKQTIDYVSDDLVIYREGTSTFIKNYKNFDQGYEIEFSPYYDVIPITSELILVYDQTKFSLLILDSTATIKPIGQYSLQNYHLLTKTFDYTLINYKPLPVALDGCLYATDGAKIRKL